MTAEPIVIIGGGHVGLTLYVDIRRASPGAEVHVICTAPERSFEPQYHLHDTLTGDDHVVDGRWSDFTRWNDAAAQVLAHANLVVLTYPDIPRLRDFALARVLDARAGHDTVIALVRGGQGGALNIASWVSGPRARQFRVLLLEDSLYGCRRAGSRIGFKRKHAMNVAYYGEQFRTDCDRIDDLLGQEGALTRSITRRRPSELVFDPLGYYIHSAVTLDAANVVRTARGERYLHYSEGIDPTLARQLDSMDQERVELAAAFGVQAQSFPDILWRQYGHPPGDSFYSTMNSTHRLYRSESPRDLADLRNARALHEDVPALFTILRLADVAGLDLPTTRAFAEALPFLLQRIGLSLNDVDRYHWPADCESVAQVRALLDAPRAGALLAGSHP